MREFKTIVRDYDSLNKEKQKQNNRVLVSLFIMACAVLICMSSVYVAYNSYSWITKNDPVITIEEPTIIKQQTAIHYNLESLEMQRRMAVIEGQILVDKERNRKLEHEAKMQKLKRERQSELFEAETEKMVKTILDLKRKDK